MGEEVRGLLSSPRESMSDRWKITVNIIQGQGDRGYAQKDSIFPWKYRRNDNNAARRGGWRKYRFEEEERVASRADSSPACLHNETMRFIITRPIEVDHLLFDLTFCTWIEAIVESLYYDKRTITRNVFIFYYIFDLNYINWRFTIKSIFRFFNITEQRTSIYRLQSLASTF